MSNINCSACETLKKTAPKFVQNGITDTECGSLAADTGLNPNLSSKHNDATDLHTANDCLIGRMENDLEKYNACDWQDFMRKFIPNLYEVIKGIICALGGIWTNIHNLWTRLTSLETRVTKLEERVDNHETRISALETDASNLKRRMTTAESNIATLQNGYTTLSDAVSKNTSDIGSLRSSLNSLSTTVSGNTTAITNLNTQYNSLKKLVDEIIAAMGGSSNTISVFKRYRYTVPAENFGEIWRADLNGAQAMMSNGTWQNLTGGIVHWMAGAGHGDDRGQGEGVWIQIPVSEMESVTGVWAQTWVLPGGNSFDGTGKPYMQAVSIQEWYEDGDNLIVNFDTHVTAPVRVTSSGTVTQNGAPYPVTIDFLVTGTKTIET